MAFSKTQEAEIKNLLKKKLDDKLSRYTRESSSMPFLSSLIQDDKKVAAYSFIHSIATSLGMSIYEDVSTILAKPSSTEVKTKVDMDGGISLNQAEVIRKIMTELRNGVRIANKVAETKEILNASRQNKKTQQEGKIADFYMKRKGVEYYFEIKTVKPNIDVFTASKKKLLEWIARKDKSVETILAFPYNPYHPEPYTRFTEQGVLEKPKEFLIDKEYWDFIGESGAFKQLLGIFSSVGKSYKKRLEDKFAEVAKFRYT